MRNEMQNDMQFAQGEGKKNGQELDMEYGRLNENENAVWKTRIQKYCEELVIEYERNNMRNDNAVWNC